MGKHTVYSVELSDELCNRLADGQSLRTVCLADDMPSKAAVFMWLRLYPEFAQAYSRAVEARSDALVEEILDIADDGTNDWMEQQEGENVGWKMNGEHIQRSRVRIDTRKWIAGKMRPKKYGDKLDLTGALTLNHASELSDDDLARIAAGGSARAADPEEGA